MPQIVAAPLSGTVGGFIRAQLADVGQALLAEGRVVEAFLQALQARTAALNTPTPIVVDVPVEVVVEPVAQTVATDPVVQTVEPVEVLPLTPPAPRPRAANDPRERRRLAAAQPATPATDEVATPTPVEVVADVAVVDVDSIDTALPSAAVAVDAPTEVVDAVAPTVEAEVTLLADQPSEITIAVDVDTPSVEVVADVEISPTEAAPSAEPALAEVPTAEESTPAETSDELEASSEDGEDAPARRPRRPRTGGRPPKKRNPAN
jgi:hypothetical protein